MNESREASAAIPRLRRLRETCARVLGSLGAGWVLVSILHGVGVPAFAAALIPAPKKLERQPSEVVIGSRLQSPFAICLGDHAPASDRGAAEWLIQRSIGEAVGLPILTESELRQSSDLRRKLIVPGSPETNEADADEVR